ncbi:hypothetical protein J4407_01590 [Candidatus Pacearchaeota archaeon]|nr:hypothetical protein [Candidatus Pacearchaeota archaeon]
MKKLYIIILIGVFIVGAFLIGMLFFDNGVTTTPGNFDDRESDFLIAGTLLEKNTDSIRLQATLIAAPSNSDTSVFVPGEITVLIDENTIFQKQELASLDEQTVLTVVSASFSDLNIGQALTINTQSELGDEKEILAQVITINIE